jgi:hypothetical protein
VKYGAERIYEALRTHMWANHILKGNLFIFYGIQLKNIKAFTMTITKIPYIIRMGRPLLAFY